MKNRIFITIGFLTWAFSAFGQVPDSVENKGSIPPHLIKAIESDGSAAHLGQMMGIMDFGDSDSLVSFVPVYYINDSTLVIGNDTLSTRKYTRENGGTSDPTMGGDLSGTASNAQIVAGAVGNVELATDAVTSDKIIAAAVGSSEIANGSVGNNDLADMAAETIKGRRDIGTGDPENLTPAQAATVIMSGLLTIDGSGSGLDADLLDGQHGSYYTALSNQDNGTANTLMGYNASGGPSEITAGTNITISGGVISSQGITGSGSTNYLTKWATGGTSLISSSIVDDGTNVAIGASTGEAKFYVNRSSGTTYDRLLQFRNGSFGNGFIGMSTGKVHIGSNTGSFSIHAQSNMGVVGTSTPTNEVVTIKNTMVGILNTSPSETLDITGGLLVSQTIKGSDGSSGAPAYRFSNDTNTGIYRPTSDNIAISTGGGERFRIDASGNVGVGNSVPSATLHVESTGAYQLLRSTNGTLSTRITLENQADNNDSWQLRRSSTGEFVLGHGSAQPYATETKIIEATSSEIRLMQDLVIDTANDVRIMVGSGSPESSVTAGVGSTYHRTDGGAGTSFYVKESGTGNTGWAAK